MRRLLMATLAAFVVLPVAATEPSTSAASAPLDMETIMANPDWIGHAVESPYWSVDGRNLYYSVQRDGSPVRDLYRVDPARGASVKLDPAAMAHADGPAVFDRAHQHAAYILHGDVFVVDLASGQRRQVTLTPQHESSPQFSADGRALQFRAGNDWFRYDLVSAVTAPVTELKLADDPETNKPDDLGELQLSLFKTLREIKADQQAMRDHTRALEAADAGRAPRPFWLGDKIRLVDSKLSPDGRWLLLVTAPKGYQGGRVPQVNHYVTDSGYTEPEDARSYVGRNDPAPQSLLLLDLPQHKSWPLKTDGLPGIKADPLAALRKQAVARLEKAGNTDEAKTLKAPAVRPVRIAAGGEDGGGGGVAWNDDGSQLAIELRAIDNKDRWIASVDFSKHALVNQQRLTDPAWINWSFNDFGWLKDGRTLWYLSEQSGYSRLYAKPLEGAARELTGAGKFEVSAPQLSADGKWFYLLA
ncbi:MAG: S9 family peptidase, partial [Rhodanobacter sp.]